MSSPQSERAQRDDRYARESFTLRRMRPWHIWALAAAAVVLVVLGLAYT